MIFYLSFYRGIIVIPYFKTSLVVLTVLLDLLLAVVVLVGVALLLRPGQPVHEVVRRLVRDVAQQPLHQRQVVLKLVLDRLPVIAVLSDKIIHATRLKGNGPKHRIWCCFDEIS